MSSYLANGDNSSTAGTMTMGRRDEPAPPPPWRCHCGHVETHPDPGTQREAAQLHAEVAHGWVRPGGAK